MRHLLLTLLLVLGLAPAPAHAKPMLTRFDALLGGSTLIVIARLATAPVPAHTAPHYDLAVERTLRGAVPKGLLRVKPSPHGHAYLAAGTRVVAFVNAAGEWTAYASVIAGPSLEAGVLRIAGFYDFNAHLVSPGVMTLAQLETYVVKGTPLAWRFRGPVLVGSPRGLVPSRIEVEATTPQVKVTGLPPLAGFPAPTVDVGSWGGDDVIVTWNRELHRPLQLTGAVTGLNRDGSIAVQYRMTYPGLLTEADLRTYLGSAKLGHPYYALELQVGAARIPVVLEKEIGHIGTLGNLPITSTSLSPDRNLKAAGVVVTLAATGFKTRMGGSSNGLVEELMTGQVKCTHRAGGAAQPCTLRYVATRFAPR